MNIVVIIQARTGSTRLPNKVLKELGDRPVLIHVVNRSKLSKRVNDVIVATTIKEQDNVIVELCKEYKINVSRGSEEDVLDRYYNCAKEYNADIVVRVTSDNPLLDYRLIDKIVDNLIEEKADYSCNNIPPSYPYGLDVECFTFVALKEAWVKAKEMHEREHVTPYIRNNRDLFKVVSINATTNNSHLRWTLDTEEDYLYIKEIYDNLYKQDSHFTTEDILNFLNQNYR